MNSVDDLTICHKACEITPAKELVWSIPGNITKGNMGNIQILDVPGDVYKFEVLK